MPPGPGPCPPPPSPPPSAPPPLPETPPALERALQTEITVEVDSDSTEEITPEDIVDDIVTTIVDEVGSFGYPNSTLDVLQTLGLLNDEDQALIDAFNAGNRQRLRQLHERHLERHEQRLERRARRKALLESRTLTQPSWSDWFLGLFTQDGQRRRRALQDASDDATANATDFCTNTTNQSLVLTLYPRAGQDVTPYVNAINNWYRETSVVVPCAEPVLEVTAEVVIDVPSPRRPPPAPPPFPPPFPPAPPTPPPPPEASSLTSGTVAWWIIPLVSALALVSGGAFCCLCCFPVALPATDCEKMPIWAHDPHHGEWLLDSVPVRRVPHEPRPHKHAGRHQHGVYRHVTPRNEDEQRDGRAAVPHDGMPYAIYGVRRDGHHNPPHSHGH